MKMKYSGLTIVLLVFAMCRTQAQRSDIVQVKDTAYMNVVQQRAAKIVDKMNLPSGINKEDVQNKIAWQYYNLNEIYKKRDSALAIVKKDKVNAAERKQTVTDAANASVDSLHHIFIAELAKNLDTAGINKVKDGMTYDVLHVTYNAYQQMLPTLNNQQKQQIYTWLVEAREHAMDAESSEKKHAWFGKYKGRINNYLSAQGYDLNKATTEWQNRIKAGKQ
ncbi:DUF3826 domain-containing protein [Ilyomonas limi]|uniref:DUF3826 domain-containing protein n=1 Tax=Ilyomonas limi TaxID=2575867 RepID=A0A4U3KTV5_9BACT|nr:DUF3826 domain-containing protein [Ilyomonas limi]TKK65811.1 DUF3826 domain-containing protein [Ilyomonas limi]